MIRSAWFHSLIGVVVLLAQESISAEPTQPQPDVIAKFGKWALPTLEKRWPNHPEWLAMFADILGGSQLGPDDGWFRKAKAQSRGNAPAIFSKLDKNGDGRFVRNEFPGSDTDFLRLDRDGDGIIAPPDFDFSAHALTPSPGMMLFAMADADGNGRLTVEEFERFFKMIDRDGQGFVSQEDLVSLLTPPARRATVSPQPPPQPSGPARMTLVKGLFQQEIGSLQSGPNLGEPAPDFTLKTLDGKESITLNERVGARPVVLIFGNFTCGPFRMQAGNVEKLYNRYKDRADFLMIYVREAHPKGGWSMASNDRVGVSYDQPTTFDERVSIAQTCQRSLGFDMPFLVDTMDDKVGARYSGMPSRFYLIDSAGKVAFKSGRGPFGFKPRELETSLIWLLNETETPAQPAPATSH